MSAPADGFVLKASSAAAKPRVLAKFRERIGPLEPRPGEPPNATLTRQKATLSRAAQRHGQTADSLYTLATPDKKYEGVREAAGAGASAYVLMRVEPSDGRGGPRSIQVIPVDEWVAFRPAILYETMDIDEAEKSLQQNDFRGSRSEARIASLRKTHREDAAADEPASADFEEDLFDDGADIVTSASGRGGGWEDEDGREGLDVEDEEQMFDDDDDEFFEEDELAAGAREEAAKVVGHEAARVRLGLADEDPEEEVDADRTEETSEWKAYQKKILKAERIERRRADDPYYDEDDDEDDDDEDDSEGGKALLRRILGDTRRIGKSEGGGESADEMAASADGAGSSTGSAIGAKRKTAAGESSCAEGKDGDTKRARTNTPPFPTQQPAPALAAALPLTRHRVTERDVVMLLHEKGAMNLKELTSYFKEFNLSAEEKKHLQEIIKNVAKLEKRGGVSQAVLKDAIIFQYKLGGK